MEVIKKIRIEIALMCCLIICIFFSENIDLAIYDKILNFDNLLNNSYLKVFFINITNIGDSIWLFLISLIIYLICFFFKSKIKNCEKIKISALFLFFTILITGIITQIIKHIIGRPRPNQVIEQESYMVDFFTFDSAFHSFPSGHTSTIFVAALTLSIFTPKLKYFYLFFALIVGLSRIAVGAHFFTDMMAGIVVAFAGIKITFIFFNKFNRNKEILVSKTINSNTFILSLIIFFICLVFLSVGSSLDIYISSLLYEGNKVFILQSYDIFTIVIREFFLYFVVLYLSLFLLVSPYLPIKKIYFNSTFKIKDGIFVLITTLFNLLVVVNVLLKNLWGRARPNDILELGGNLSFSPWYKISNACNTNCSFVSGDASVGFSIIALYFITKNKNFIWLALFSGFLLGITRILEGGHFSSDVIMAGLLVFILSYIEYYLYNKKFIFNAI